MRLTPSRYRAITIAALFALLAIIVTGAAVRLTGSGLGCADWPACSSARFIDVSTRHAAIEQLNRLFTGLVSVAVIAAVLGSLVRVPRRRDLTWLSLGLVAGVLAQIVLGGITVLVDLHPLAVQAHMIVSLVLVANAVVLVHHASEPDEGEAVRPVSPEISRHTVGIAAFTALALVTGTVVTGAGPHAGDEEARRFRSRSPRRRGSTALGDHRRDHDADAGVATARAHGGARRAAEWLLAWIVIALLQGRSATSSTSAGCPRCVGLHVLGATGCGR